MADRTGETTIIIEEAQTRGYATPRDAARQRCRSALERLERATARLDEALSEDDDAEQR